MFTKSTECKKAIPCNLDQHYLCASDGKRYHNECAMRRHMCIDKQAKIIVKNGEFCEKYDALLRCLIILFLIMPHWTYELIIAKASLKTFLAPQLHELVSPRIWPTLFAILRNKLYALA